MCQRPFIIYFHVLKLDLQYRLNVVGVGELVFEGIKDIIVDDLHLIELVPCFHEAGLLVVTY
jgi:hypothetical protein